MRIVQKQLNRLLVFFILSLLYISDVRFFFLPNFIRARFFLGILGIIVFICANKSFTVKKDVIYNVFWLLLLLLPFLLTVLVNNNIDQWGFRPLLNVLVFFSAYLIIFLLNKLYGKKVNLDFVIKLIIGSTLLNILIAIFMFCIPPMKEYVFLLQGANVSNNSRMYYTSSFRLFGIGNFFFYQAGVYCSWVLVLIVYLLRKRGNKLLYLFLYVFVLVSGMLFARTTIVGFIISVIYYLLPKRFTHKSIALSIAKSFILIFVTISLGGGLKNFLLENSDDKMLHHAFEFVYNYIDKGTIETSSTNHLATMYVFPDNLTTWLVGDAVFTSQDGTYYMSTDVGYLRVLYFMGFLGIFVLYSQKIYLLTSTVKLINFEEKNNYIILLSFLFGLTLILNLKGFTDLDIFIFLFFWVLSNNNRVNV